MITEGFDRSTPAYVDSAVMEALNNGGQVFGVRTSETPETLDELRAIVAAARNHDCGVPKEIDQTVETIATDPNPDEIVRRLPYDPWSGSLIFILPRLTAV